MKKRAAIRLIPAMSAFVIISLISGCGCKTIAQKKPAPPENAVVCKDPRHNMCTREYRPVCGYFANGSTKTFSNACTACSDQNVISYTQGPCGEE